MKCRTFFTRIAVIFLCTSLLVCLRCIVRADEPAVAPDIVDGVLSLVFQNGVPADSVVTVTAGSSRATTTISPASGGLNIVALTSNPQVILSSLESGRSVDIQLSGQNTSGEWKIEPIINFMAPVQPFLPIQFNGAVDTTSTGSLSASPTGAHAQVTFTARKHNYVSFNVDQPLPADTIGLGGIVRDDPTSTIPGLISARVEDAQGEIFGYSFHGSDLDDFELTQSTTLADITYRFGGSPSAEGDPKTTAPVPPLKIVAIVMEPGKWLWAGKMSSNITEVYAIRQISSKPTSLPPTVTVMADDAVQGNKSMSGFFGQGEPNGGDSLMAALRPQIWRIGFNYKTERDRLKSLGIPMIMILSDIWGYQHTNSPSLNWDAFEQRVKQLALDGRSYDTIWDLWNEPDNTIDQFAPSHDIRDFYAIYNHAYHAVREALGPNVPIEGPSYAKFNIKAIQDFLDYCVANGLEVNYLSWHELDKDRDIAMIPNDVAEVKALLAKNPQYKALKLTKIQINETVGPTAQYEPGEIIGYLYYLEKSGVDGACKGCWPDSQGQINGFNHSIDGIIDPATNRPRAAYWAYQLYAAGADRRVNSTSSDIRLAPIASVQNADIEILIGNHAVRSWPQAIDECNLDVTGLSNIVAFHHSAKVNVTIRELSDTGEEIVTAPTFVKSLALPIVNGEVSLSLPAFEPHQVCIADVMPAENDKQ